jgi:hypothetical protein
MMLNEFTKATIVGRSDNLVTLAVDIDWDALREAFRGMAKAAGNAARQFGKTIKQMSVLLHHAANDDLRVAGLEARYYVRGGLLCPDIDALVLALMRDPASVAPDDEGLLMDLLSRENRALLAAKAIEGYVTHTPEPWRHPEAPSPMPLVWYRFLAGTAVLVGTVR